jgi:hypothetical protein
MTRHQYQLMLTWSHRTYDDDVVYPAYHPISAARAISWSLYIPQVIAHPPLLIMRNAKVACVDPISRTVIMRDERYGGDRLALGAQLDIQTFGTDERSAQLARSERAFYV